MVSAVGCKTALILLSAQAQHSDPQRYAKVSSSVASLLAVSCTRNPHIGQQFGLSARNDLVLEDLFLSSPTMKELFLPLPPPQASSLFATFNEDTYSDSQHLRW